MVQVVDQAKADLRTNCPVAPYYSRSGLFQSREINAIMALSVATVVTQRSMDPYRTSEK